MKSDNFQTARKSNSAKIKSDGTSKKAIWRSNKLRAEEGEDESEINALNNSLVKVNKELVIADNRFEHCVAS